MNEQPKIDLEHYSSEGMPTILLCTMLTIVNMNRVCGYALYLL